MPWLESQGWNRDQLLVHLIRLHLDEQPIHLPLVLWVRLVSSTYTNDVPQLPSIDSEDDMFLLSLCKLALNNFSATAPRIIPFLGLSSITDTTVPLFQFVVDLLVARMGNVHLADSFELEPLTKLFIIHDYAVSHLSSRGSSDGSDVAILVMGNAWGKIRWVEEISEKDSRAVCQQAETVILQNLTLGDGWYNSSLDKSVYCYIRLLVAYHSLCGSHVASPEFFKRLVSDFCSSLMTAPP